MFDTRYILIGIAAVLRIIMKCLTGLIIFTVYRPINNYLAILNKMSSLNVWLNMILKDWVQLKPIWTIDCFQIIRIFFDN